MSEHKFDVGEYTTRGGRKVRVVCNDKPGEWPILGYDVDNGHAHTWRADGQYTSLGGGPLDLMPPVPPQETLEVWVNLYRAPDGRLAVGESFNSEHKARACGQDGHGLVFLGTHRVVVHADGASEYDAGLEAAARLLEDIMPVWPVSTPDSIRALRGKR